jgi:hypothetical protein
MNVADWHQRRARLEHALSRRPHVREDDEGALAAAWLASCLDVQELLPAALLDYLARRFATDWNCALSTTPAATAPMETVVFADADHKDSDAPTAPQRYRASATPDASVMDIWKAAKLPADCTPGEVIVAIRAVDKAHPIFSYCRSAMYACIKRVRARQ